MVKVGIAGIGFMGVTHFKAWEEVAGAKVTAICTRSEKKLSGDWSDIQGNFGGGGGVQDLAGVARCRELRELLADPSIDLVDLCLPTRLHPEAAVAALEQGKHVLVEKPIALTTADADRMIAAAEANGRLLMVAQVLRFWPEWLWLKQAIEGGDYGELVGLNLRRVISMPDWSRDVADLAANGGPLIDLHIHDVDFILYLLGKPAQVYATGRNAGDYINYVAANLAYPGGPTVSAQSGAVTMKGRMFQHQYEAYFERATVAFGEASEPAGIDPALKQGGSQVLTVYAPDGTASFPKPPSEPAFNAQLGHAARCVERGEPSPIIGAQSARDALAVVELEAQSVLSGRVVDVP
ncbi:MAG: Gfo/Idh/MocA family oxidoreductase [Armatimonadetes bacterium]|nr:Gfo/Idh/MocA family oxidoreductase [Armatimonadota bacterium]